MKISTLPLSPLTIQSLSVTDRKADILPILLCLHFPQLPVWCPVSVLLEAVKQGPDMHTEGI